MPPLFTIGYEQASLGDVIAALKAARVNLVIDTRAVAASRRAGFSKKMLSATLDDAGIAYIHLQNSERPPKAAMRRVRGITKGSGRFTTSTSAPRTRRSRSTIWRRS